MEPHSPNSPAPPPTSQPQIHVVVRQTWLSRKPNTRSSIITAWLIFILILTSALYWKNYAGLESLMPASGEAVFIKKEYWRLWTTLFAHADVGHLLSNSLTFFVVGYFLIGYFSLWFFPIAGFAIGGLVNSITLLTMPPTVKLIGVSGVVYWMGGAWLVLYFLLDQRKTRTQRTLRALGVALGVFMPAAAFDPSISYLTHLYGFIAGVLSGTAYYFINKSKFKRAERKEIIVEQEPILPEQDQQQAPTNQNF